MGAGLVDCLLRMNGRQPLKGWHAEKVACIYCWLIDHSVKVYPASTPLPDHGISTAALLTRVRVNGVVSN